LENEKSKKILVISPVPSHPQNIGNRTRIFNFLSNLKKLGYEVHFLYSYSKIANPGPSSKLDLKKMYKTWDKVYIIPHDFKTKRLDFIEEINTKIGSWGIFLEKHLPRLHSLQRKFRKTLHRKKSFRFMPADEPYNTKLDKFIKKLNQKKQFDAVVVEYFFFSKALELFNEKTLKIIDTHDVFSNRHKPYLNKKIDYEGYSIKTHEETKALNRADIIIAIQEEEAKFFRKILNKNKKIISIGDIQNLKKPIKRNSKRKNIVFIGSLCPAAKYGINDFFLKKIFPKIKKKYPDAKFLIAGSMSDITKESKGVIRLGKVKDIKKVYNSSDIIISPLFVGTGLKIKNTEALAHSIPLITTSLGAKGLEKGKNKAFLVANTADEFIKQINKLLTDKKLYEKISENAHKFIKEYNKKNIKTLKEIFKNE